MSKQIHDKWTRAYRTPENAHFYSMACNVIAEYFGKVEGPVLDAGCGSGEKTLRLAELGYAVVAVDFADVALRHAQEKLQDNGNYKGINFVRADLTRLAFPDASLGAAVVWGVLMHIPNLERVVAELSRVLKPGAKIVVYDANPVSFDAKLLTLLKIIRRTNRSVRTRLGVENWLDSLDGQILVRWTRYSVLRDLFNKSGLTLLDRRAGQFTEFYVHCNSAIVRSCLHKVNNTYFKYIRWWLPSYAIMVFGLKDAEMKRSKCK